MLCAVIDRADFLHVYFCMWAWRMLIISVFSKIDLKVNRFVRVEDTIDLAVWLWSNLIGLIILMIICTIQLVIIQEENGERASSNQLKIMEPPLSTCIVNKIAPKNPTYYPCTAVIIIIKISQVHYKLAECSL